MAVVAGVGLVVADLGTVVEGEARWWATLVAVLGMLVAVGVPAAAGAA